ncbi:MAG: hypothetical protein NTV22_18745 [bacterium]|nr:hypothetical protein [bacterium]
MLNIQYPTLNIQGRTICAELHHWIFFVGYWIFAFSESLQKLPTDLASVEAEIERRPAARAFISILFTHDPAAGGIVGVWQKEMMNIQYPTLNIQ